MLLADAMSKCMCEIRPGIWVIAKPIPGPFKTRLHDAIQVLKGKAEAVKFIEQ